MSAFVINSYAFAKAIVPTDISNLVVWLDAGLGLFDATSGGSAVTTDASAVARWEDQSGNANHFTQSTSASRPILKTAIQNSLNVIRFDGINDAVVCASNTLFKDVSGATVFAVRKCASNPTIEQNIFRANINGANSSRIFFSVGFNSGKANAGGRRLDADSFAGIQSTNNVSTSVFQVQSALYDYTNTDLYLYLNGSQEASNTSWQTTGSTSNADSSQINVGGNAIQNANFFNGDIAEVIAYNRALTTAEREDVEKYLNDKYAIY
jgi:hypothetical protein